MCGQIVLCRGVNDGEELRRTITDLMEYYPALGSVSIVPAGLTKYRDGLYPLTDFDKDEAGAVIDMVDELAEVCVSRFGVRLFYVADEFYLKAERHIPPDSYYDGYPQIENGVGMLRSFTEDFEYAYEDVKGVDLSTRGTRCVTVVTGVAAYPMLAGISDRLMSRFPNIRIDVRKIINNFFGESITVSGLLTGKDMLLQLSGTPLGDEVLIPRSSLRSDEDVFLCGMTLGELQEALGVPVRAVDNDGYELLEALFGAT